MHNSPQWDCQLSCVVTISCVPSIHCPCQCRISFKFGDPLNISRESSHRVVQAIATEAIVD